MPKNNVECKWQIINKIKSLSKSRILAVLFHFEKVAFQFGNDTILLSPFGAAISHLLWEKSMSCRTKGGALQFLHADQSAHDNVYDDVGQGTGLEFLHDVLAVGDGGGETDVELVGHFLVDEALGQQDGHLSLAG